MLKTIRLLNILVFKKNNGNLLVSKKIISNMSVFKKNNSNGKVVKFSVGSNNNKLLYY